MASSRFENRYFSLVTLLGNLLTRFSRQYQRYLAHRDRRQVVKAKGGSVLNRRVKKEIKAYARERYGSKAYWPYLAFYTELRGAFKKGWLPYDYWRYDVLPGLNPRYLSYISDQKSFDHVLFGDFAIRPLFVFISGNYYNADLELFEMGELKKFLSEYNDMLVVKEGRGTHGLQVRMVHSSEFDPAGLRAGINYVIQPFVKQYKTISDLYPHSINTFRAVTYLRPDGSIHVKSIILRFGINGMKIDNLSSGGHFIYFDASGKPTGNGYNLMGIIQGERHVNTGYRYSDMKLPMYQEIGRSCIAAHKKYPYLRVIGWDIFLNEKGEPKLIEWNAVNPGFHPEEALFGPLWSDDDGVFPTRKKG